MDRKITLPPDPDDQNNERAEWAGVALDAFMGETGCDEEDVVCDLLANLRHWCDRNGQNWESQLNRGMNHYEAETMEAGEV